MKARSLLFIILSFYCFSAAAIAQTEHPLSVDKWIHKLADPNDKKNYTYFNITQLLNKVDRAEAFDFIHKLEDYSNKKNNYYLARFLTLKAYVILFKSTKDLKSHYSMEEVNAVSELMINAIKLCYEINDDYLTAFVSSRYGYNMYVMGSTELAVMHMLNSAELYDKINEAPVFAYDNIAMIGLLWYVREYKNSIKYGLKTINYLEGSDYIDDYNKDKYKISTYNTIALSYQKLKQYDSAFVYFQKGLEIEKKINFPVWKGIIYGNLGQIYFAKENYSTALPLFEFDYKISLDTEEYDNAANSLQWAARSNLNLDNKELALTQIREAFKIWHKSPRPSYGVNLYNTASEIFKAFGIKDSVIHYSNLYNKLNDSLEKSIYQSSISISKLRLNDEKNKYEMMNLQRTKQQQIQQRNFIIGGILLIALFVLIYMNRRWHLLNHQKQLALKEKELIELDMVSAKEQLQLFTKNVIQKTNLIEKLENQLQTKINSVENQDLLTELSNQYILTEEDWDKFKSIFEKAFPMFFQRLKSNTPDITMAEQRMAALSRLQLTTRQMASMLGISESSVHKTKQRLRQRFNITTDDNLEEFISEI